MKYPDLDGHLILLIIICIASFVLMLLSLNYPKEQFESLTELFTVVFTAITAGSAALSARVAKSLSERWKDEERLKILLSKWEPVEALANRIYIRSSAVRNRTPESVPSDVDRLIKSGTLESYRNLQELFLDNRYGDHILLLVDDVDFLIESVENLYSLTVSWVRWEENPDSRGLLNICEQMKDRLVNIRYEALEIDRLFREVCDGPEIVGIISEHTGSYLFQFYSERWSRIIESRLMWKPSTICLEIGNFNISITQKFPPLHMGSNIDSIE